MKKVLILAVSLFLFGCGSDGLKDCKVCSDSSECLSGVCVPFYHQDLNFIGFDGYYTCSEVFKACSSYQEQSCQLDVEQNGGYPWGSRQCTEGPA